MYIYENSNTFVTRFLENNLIKILHRNNKQKKDINIDALGVFNLITEF
jgi:hypothetical protein